MQPTADAVRAQLERILASTQFAGAARMGRFLRYVVERTLAGEGERLKEFVIGLEVFDRGDGYDPRVDSIVRVEAGRLRGKLEEFYHGPGCDDAVRIGLKKGGYAPYFEQREVAPPEGATQARRARATAGVALAGVVALLVAVAMLWDLSRQSPAAAATAGATSESSSVASNPAVGAQPVALAPSVPATAAVTMRPEPAAMAVDAPRGADPAATVIAVLPIVPYGEDLAAVALGEQLTEGVAMALVQGGALQVVPSARTARYRDPGALPDDLGETLGAQLLLRGRVTREAGQLRVDLMLMDGSLSIKPWAESFEGPESERDALEQRIATAVETAAIRRTAAR